MTGREILRLQAFGLWLRMTLEVAVHLRPAVAEEAPEGAVFFEGFEIELLDEDAFFGFTKRLYEVAALIGDEGMAVEGLICAVGIFLTDAV